MKVLGKELKNATLQFHKANGSQSFGALQGWFRRFKKHNHLTFRCSRHVAQHAVDVTDQQVDILTFLIRT